MLSVRQKVLVILQFPDAPCFRACSGEEHARKANLLSQLDGKTLQFFTGEASKETSPERYLKIVLLSTLILMGLFCIFGEKRIGLAFLTNRG